ncbi:hypothetical protein NIES4102_00980 [Chondrocystis sp. NIES-4102]|nr:hypothetical protein NIES4102_00980 [Chondrocystis sp. NIES-4102]
MSEFYPNPVNSNPKINSVSQLFRDCKSPDHNCRSYKKIFKSSLASSVINNSSGHEIVISNSGLAKIDNFSSCLDLEECDFIVF